MRKYAWSLVLSALFSLSGGHRVHALEIVYALSIEPEWSEHVPDQVRKSYGEAIESAIAVVRSYAPENQNHLFNWRGSRENLENKSFHLFLTVSYDPYVQRLGGVEKFSPETDSGTAILADKGHVQITTFLLLDRIFFDPEKKDRNDGFQRLVAALAHEIFGNVQTALPHQFTEKPKPSELEKKNAEIKAYTAGTLFLERLIASPEFEVMEAGPKGRYKKILAEEIRGLKFWEQQKISPKKSPALMEASNSSASLKEKQ